MSKKNDNQEKIQVQRIYTKDISFEVPNAPNIFQKEWKPKTKLDLDTNFTKLLKNVYEVVLRTTMTVKLDNTVAFICEVQQAGIFSVSCIETDKLLYYLGVYCPNIIFPYTRECISNQIFRGTFPQINIELINFHALFKKYIEEKEKVKNNKISQKLGDII